MKRDMSLRVEAEVTFCALHFCTWKDLNLKLQVKEANPYESGAEKRESGTIKLQRFSILGSCRPFQSAECRLLKS